MPVNYIMCNYAQSAPPVVAEPTLTAEMAYYYFQKSFYDENSSYDGLPT